MEVPVPVSLRHALLVTLLDGDATGYELAKRFDVSVANYWHAHRTQLYAELRRMEADGLVAGETVVQTDRPNKRVFTITEAGRQELRRATAAPSPRGALKDQLLVKVASVDVVDADAVLADLADRRAASQAQLARYERDRERMLRGRDEPTFLASARRIGPYLTLLRGIAYERENVAWCDRAIEAIETRRAARSRTVSR